VFQVSEAEPEKLAAVVRNVKNVMAALGEGVGIEVVAHGEGIIAVLHESPIASELPELLDAGVLVVGCANTLQRKSIPEDRLASGVRLVPAGIAEIVEKQWAGWAYIRPA
jgi:hypothetical protein